MIHQLPLSISFNQKTALSNFYWNDNAILKQQFDWLIQNKGEPLLYIWGNRGSGKSHLLQGSCDAISKLGIDVAYLPLELLKKWGPSTIDGVEHQSFIAIDGLEHIAGDPAWETALFHLYNKAQENEKTTLLVAATQSPLLLPFCLPDLRSRLASGLVIYLKELPDILKMTVLQEYAKQRGFILSKAVAHFLMNRCERNMHKLVQLLNQLDDASLAAQRKITIPFVKSITHL